MTGTTSTRSLYLNGGPQTAKQQRVVKRNSNLTMSGSGVAVRKSPSIQKSSALQASSSGKQTQYGGLTRAAHKKQSASSGNLFVAQTHLMQLKLLESQSFNNNNNHGNAAVNNQASTKAKKQSVASNTTDKLGPSQMKAEGTAG